MGSNISGKPYINLRRHPNYKDEQPADTDTIITFTLRFIGNLISPEQENNESVDIECVDIKRALQCAGVVKDITNIWLNHQLKTKE